MFTAEAVGAVAATRAAPPMSGKRASAARRRADDDNDDNGTGAPELGGTEGLLGGITPRIGTN
jgi:hypothetical protein